MDLWTICIEPEDQMSQTEIFTDKLAMVARVRSLIVTAAAWPFENPDLLEGDDREFYDTADSMSHLALHGLTLHIAHHQIELGETETREP